MNDLSQRTVLYLHNYCKCSNIGTWYEVNKRLFFIETMEVRISSLLSLILLWNSPCISSSRTERSDIYERNSQQSPETLMSQTNHLQIRPENSVHIHPGETLTLQCKDEGNEGEQHKYKEISFYSMLGIQIYNLTLFS